MHAAVRVGRSGGNPSDDWAAHALAINSFKFIADDAEPARLELVDVPQIAATAMFFEP